jgi:hypothetical protein
MTAVTASLFFGLRWLEGGAENGEPSAGWRAAALSGAALMAAAYGKPMLAVLALPVWVGYLRFRRWRALVAWGLGALLAVGVITGVAVALTGHPSAYLGVERLGVTVCDPGVMPIEPQPPEGRIGPGTERPTGGAWSWIFHPPPVPLGELLENLGYFLWGRHTGLFLYFPFALLATLLFLTTGGGRTRERWALLGSLAAVALLFLILVSHNWHGGGGFVGNRYYVNAYPAFLFLVTRLRGGRAVLVGFALGGLFLGTLLLSPFGRSAPEPTLQSHVRGAAFRLFPRELSLREIPGYRRQSVGPYALSARSDQFLPRGESAWLTGASTVEIWIVGEKPFDSATFLVRAPEAGNRVVLRLGGDRHEVELAPGESRRVTLRPTAPSKVRTQNGHRFYVYRMLVESDGGRARTCTRHYPPASCERFAFNESNEESWFLGAELTMLGTGSLLDGGEVGVDGASERGRPFSARWGQIEVPPSWTAGGSLEVPVRLFNTSEVAWENRGAARVKLAYRWRSADGAPVGADDHRIELPLPIGAGERAAVRAEVTAPAAPGRYTLEIDLVYEHVAWFADRGGESFRAEVEVLPGAEPTDAQELAARP